MTDDSTISCGGLLMRMWQLTTNGRYNPEMGKLVDQLRTVRKPVAPAAKLTRLRGERRKLRAKLAKLDDGICKLSDTKAPAPSVAALDQWLDELSADFPDVPPLQTNFFRADLYDDHD